MNPHALRDFLFREFGWDIYDWDDTDGLRW